MKIWAFDLATKTGWAIQNNGHYLNSGWWNLREKGDDQGMIFVNFTIKLNHLLEAYGAPSTILYEDQLMRGKYARQVLLGLRGVLLSWAAEKGIPTSSKNIMTMKKKAREISGYNFTLKKDLMIAAANIISGREISSDDEADAIVMLECI